MTGHNHVLTRHGRMADDSYWEGGRRPWPTIDARSAATDVSNRFGLPGTYPLIRLFNELEMGFDVSPISEGQQVPTVDPDKPALVRLVQESRTVTPRIGRSIGNLLLRWDTPESFTKKLLAMERQPLYTGRAASYRFIQEETGDVVVVRKDVRYVRASTSGDQLAGVHSSKVKGLKTGNDVLAPPVVGAIYGEDDTYLVRTSSAQILRPIIHPSVGSRQSVRFRRASLEDAARPVVGAF